MKYLLDTNICVHFFRGKFNLSEKFKSVEYHSCSISIITLAELNFGADNSNFPDKNHQLIKDFIKEIKVVPLLNAVQLYGKEKVRLRKSGRMISDFDLLIGCTAISNNLIMVTENIKEFQRIENINIENWINRSTS